MRKTVREIVEKMTSSDNYLIFSVGDSITEGARATSPDNNYTAVLTRGIAARFPMRTVLRYDGKRHRVPDGELRPIESFGEAVTVQNGTEGKSITVARCGIGGNTVRRLLNRKQDFIGKEIDGRLGDLFLIVAGINDSLVKDPAKYTEPTQYHANLYELLDEIERANPEADVILMTPTYYGDGSTADIPLSEYAEEMRRVAKEKCLPLVDLHALWMQHLVVGGPLYGQGDWLVSDKCHPSDKGHAAIAAEILRVLFEK